MSRLLKPLRVLDTRTNVVHWASRKWVAYNLGDVEDIITDCDVNTAVVTGAFMSLHSTDPEVVTCLECIAAEAP